MQEYIFIEFIVSEKDAELLSEKLSLLNEDFRIIYDGVKSNSVEIFPFYYFSGHITPEYATFIKLNDSFLSERMRISYISNHEKNKYRE